LARRGSAEEKEKEKKKEKGEKKMLILTRS